MKKISGHATTETIFLLVILGFLILLKVSVLTILYGIHTSLEEMPEKRYCKTELKKQTTSLG